MSGGPSELEDSGPAGSNPNASASNPNFPDSDPADSGGGGGGGGDDDNNDTNDNILDRIAGGAEDVVDDAVDEAEELAERAREAAENQNRQTGGDDDNGGGGGTTAPPGGQQTEPDQSQQDAIDEALSESDAAGSARVDNPTTPEDESVNQDPTQGPFPDEGPAGGNPDVATGDVNLPDAERGDVTDELADGRLTRSEVEAETRDLEAPGPTGDREEALQGPLGSDRARQDSPGLEQESGRVARQARRLERRVLRESGAVGDTQDVRIASRDGVLTALLTERGQDDVATLLSEQTGVPASRIGVSERGEASFTEIDRTLLTGPGEQAATQAAEAVEGLPSGTRQSVQAIRRQTAIETAEQTAAERAGRQISEQLGDRFQRGEDFRVETDVQDGEVTAQATLTEEGRTTLGEQAFLEQFPQVQDPTRGEDFQIVEDGDGVDIQLTEQGRERVQSAASDGEQFGDIPELNLSPVRGLVSGAGPGLGLASGTLDPDPDDTIAVDDELRALGEEFTEEVAEPAGGAAGEFAERAVLGAAGTAAVISGRDASSVPAGGPELLGEPLAASTGGAAEGTVRGAVNIFNVPANAAGLIEAGEFIGEAGAETVQGDGEQFADEAGTAAVRAGEAFLEQASEQPFQTGGALFGSLAGSAAGIAGASRLSRTGGRATAFAVQPGEELVGIAGNRLTRVATNARTAERLFPDDEPLIFSEEAAIRTARAAGRRTRQRLPDVDADIGTLPELELSRPELSREAARREATALRFGAAETARNVRQRASALEERVRSLFGDSDEELTFESDEPPIRSVIENPLDIEADTTTDTDSDVGPASPDTESGGGSPTNAGGGALLLERPGVARQRVIEREAEQEAEQTLVETAQESEVRTEAETETEASSRAEALLEEAATPAVDAALDGAFEAEFESEIAGTETLTELDQELGTETELLQETELETELLQETELEAEQEAELEAELEQELELEAEAEAEAEPRREPAGEDDNDPFDDLGPLLDDGREELFEFDVADPTRFVRGDGA
jgi:hypothetical protein